MASKKKSTAPGKLSISRKGVKFTCKWSTYSYNSQQFQYSVAESLNSKGEKNWTTWKAVSIGSNASSKTMVLDWKDGKSNAKSVIGKKYPADTSDAIYGFKFRVRGKANDRDWSEWSPKAFDIELPVATLKVEGPTSSPWNVSRFTWSASDNEHKAAVDVMVRSGLQAKGGSVSWGEWTSRRLSDSISPTENTAYVTGATPYKRIVQVYARGPRGRQKDAVEKSYVYAKPNKPLIDAANTVASGNTMKAKWIYSNDGGWRPLNADGNQMVIQEHVGEPDADGNPEAGASWDDVSVVKDSDYGSWSWFSDTTMDAGEARWVRVAAQRDSWSTPSDAVMVDYAGPEAPSSVTVELLDNAGSARVTIGEATANAAIETMIGVRVAEGPFFLGASQLVKVAVIPHGETDANITIPRYSASTAYQIVAINYVTKDWRGSKFSEPTTSESTGTLPSAPVNVTLAKTDVEGEVRVTWEATWDAYDGSRLEWADSANAWESTDEPETFDVDTRAMTWIISGLDVGKTWYVGVRSKTGTGTDDVAYGPVSDIVAIALTEAPVQPILTAPAYTVPGQDVQVSWTYVSGDGSAQASAQIAEDASHEPVASVIGTSQHAYVGSGWAEGTSHTLYAQTTSETGVVSEWSEGVTVTVVNAPVCTVVNPFSQDEAVDEDGDPIYDIEGNPVVANTMASMPLSVAVSGSNGGTCRAVVTKDGDSTLLRGDGSEAPVYDGQVIASAEIAGDGTIVLETADLARFMEDGGTYLLTCSVTDPYGQTDVADSIPFTFAPTRKSHMPTAVIDCTTYRSVKATVITPTAGEGTVTDDTYDGSGNVTEERDYCDIYRLTADGAELIVEGAEWGTPYADPYPALGNSPVIGHRVVCRTPEGVMETADSNVTWRDYNPDDPDQPDFMPALGTVLDWDGNQLELPWNNELSDTYTKDFTRRTHLGGSVTGHWNPAIERDRSVSTQMARGMDDADIALLRDMAQHPGEVHIRTVDGVSVTGNVQLSGLDRSYDSKAVGVTLEVNQVDASALEGLTLDDFVEGLG